MISTSKNTWSDTVLEYAFDLLSFCECVSEVMICERSLVSEWKIFFALKEEEMLD